MPAVDWHLRAAIAGRHFVNLCGGARVADRQVGYTVLQVHNVLVIED